MKGRDKPLPFKSFPTPLLIGMRKSFKLTLQLIISALVGVEISIPPNPYADWLVVMLVLYICLQYNIDQKITQVIEKYNPF